MTKRAVISKLAEAYYLKRQQEGIDGSAEYDWYFAECAVHFFEQERRPGEWWWEKDNEDYKFFEPLYNHLTGRTHEPNDSF